MKNGLLLWAVPAGAGRGLGWPARAFRSEPERIVGKVPLEQLGGALPIPADEERIVAVGCAGGRRQGARLARQGAVAEAEHSGQSLQERVFRAPDGEFLVLQLDPALGQLGTR